MGAYLLVFTRRDGLHSTLQLDFQSDDAAIEHAGRVLDEHVVAAAVVRGRNADARLGMWHWRGGEKVWDGSRPD